MRAWTREFARPLPVGAAAVLALNDHVLKHAHVLPGWVTGKLSDVAGLFFFPILLFALAGALFGAPRSRVTRAIALAGGTAAIFALIKVVPDANAVASAVLGHVALDPTDLLALPMVAASVAYLRNAPAERASGALRGAPYRAFARHAAVILAGVASLATSAPRQVRNYPAWEVRGATYQRAGCVELGVAVVKSGKTGFGVIVTHSREESCVVKVVGARARVGSENVSPLALPDWDGDRSMYLAFAFDNEAQWNAAVRDGTLALDVDAAGQRTVLEFRLEHVWTGAHREAPQRAAPSPPPPPTPPPPSAEGNDP